MISNIAGGFAQGGMMGALRGTPYVGLAVAAGEAANDTAIWLTNQRAANAQYQSIYGGENFTVGGVMNGVGAFFGGNSDDRSGISQRIQEQGFVLQNRFSGGGMTEEMSSPNRGDSKRRSRACIQLMFPRSVLISPLWAT